MNFEDIIFEKKDGIAKVTFNRPQVYNAVRFETFKELLIALEDIEKDNTVGVMVVTGAGEKAFCSGGDVNIFKNSTPKEARQQVPYCLKIASAMRHMGRPIIAAVNGFCMGWGLEFTTFCDLVIASDNAVFSQPELLVGSCSAFGATQMFSRLMGERRAREAIFLAKRFDAREAERIGLINKVVPPDKLEEEVDAWCKRILEMSPQATRMAKTCLNFGADLSITALNHGAIMWQMLHGTEEWIEGMGAFLEKRKPDYHKFRK